MNDLSLKHAQDNYARALEDMRRVGAEVLYWKSEIQRRGDSPYGDPTEEQVKVATDKLVRLSGEYEARSSVPLESPDFDWAGLIKYLIDEWPAYAAAAKSRTHGISGVIEHPRTVARFEVP